MKVKIINSCKLDWYKVGDVYEVQQWNKNFYQESSKIFGEPCTILKSDCEVIADDESVNAFQYIEFMKQNYSTELAPFDWEKYKTGWYDAISEYGVLREVLKMSDGHLISVDRSLQMVMYVPNQTAIQLRPKVVEKTLYVHHDTAVRRITASIPIYCVRETYSPDGTLIKAEII